MHRRLWPCFVFLVLACGGWAGEPRGFRYAADRIIIKFKPQTVRSFPSPDSAQSDAACRTLGLAPGLKIQETGYGRYLRASRGKSDPALDLSRPLHLLVPPGESVESLLQRLQDHPDLEYVEPDYIGTGFETVPNDPNFSSQWYHKNTASTSAVPADIRSTLAWDITQGLATGNDNTGVGYPASMQVVIAVGATGANDRRMSWSNYGTALDLVAPGDNMTCVNRDGTLRTGSYGTSYASPLVAGVASLLVGLRPGLNPAQVCALLAASADDRVGDASDAAGFDNYYGWGRLNACNALVTAMSSVQCAPDTNGAPVLSWSSPPNASNRTPCRVQCKTNLQNAWSNSVETQLVYGAATTTWTSTNAGVECVYYRIAIQPH